MTHEEKLEELQGWIREALPRLMKIERGLFVNYLGDVLEFIRINPYDEYECLNIHDETEDLVVVDCLYDGDTEDLKIIGKDILLSDIKDWFVEKYLSLPSQERHTGVINKMGYLCTQWEGDHLKDQKPELIDYLHSLKK